MEIDINKGSWAPQEERAARNRRKAFYVKVMLGILPFSNKEPNIGIKDFFCCRVHLGEYFQQHYV